MQRPSIWQSFTFLLRVHKYKQVSRAGSQIYRNRISGGRPVWVKLPAHIYCCGSGLKCQGERVGLDDVLGVSPTRYFTLRLEHCVDVGKPVILTLCILKIQNIWIWETSLVLSKAFWFNWLSVIGPQIPQLYCINACSSVFTYTAAWSPPLSFLVGHYVLSEELFRWLMSLFSTICRLLVMTHAHWWHNTTPSSELVDIISNDQDVLARISWDFVVTESKVSMLEHSKDFIALYS